MLSSKKCIVALVVVLAIVLSFSISTLAYDAGYITGDNVHLREYAGTSYSSLGYCFKYDLFWNRGLYVASGGTEWRSVDMRTGAQHDKSGYVLKSYTAIGTPPV